MRRVSPGLDLIVDRIYRRCLPRNRPLPVLLLPPTETPDEVRLLWVHGNMHSPTRRVAGFFSTASLSGAFGGILAYGIIQLNGQHGHSGWQWIFIIEGIITVLVAIASFWVVQDFPDTAKFLKPEESTFLLIFSSSVEDS